MPLSSAVRSPSSRNRFLRHELSFIAAKLGITESKCHVWCNTHQVICIDPSLSGASYTAHLHKPPIHPLFELQQLPLSQYLASSPRGCAAAVSLSYFPYRITSFHVPHKIITEAIEKTIANNEPIFPAGFTK